MVSGDEASDTMLEMTCCLVAGIGAVDVEVLLTELRVVNGVTVATETGEGVANLAVVRVCTADRGPIGEEAGVTRAEGTDSFFVFTGVPTGVIFTAIVGFDVKTTLAGG